MRRCQIAIVYAKLAQVGGGFSLLSLLLRSPLVVGLRSRPNAAFCGMGRDWRSSFVPMLGPGAMALRLEDMGSTAPSVFPCGTGVSREECSGSSVPRSLFAACSPRRPWCRRCLHG